MLFDKAMITLTVNKQKIELDVSEDMPLLWVLRDLIGLTGTKYGCGIGLCGACTVHLNGRAVKSCSVPVGAVGDKEVLTIEGILDDPIAQKLLKSWTETEPTQCGYCQPGQIMTALALLKENSHPSKNEIIKAMTGHLCRCGTYQRIYKAIQMAAGITEDV